MSQGHPKAPAIRSIVALTLPIAKRQALRHKPYLLLLLLVSLLLGFVPTFKSELESGLLQQMNRVLAAPPERVGDVFRQPVDRFSGDKPSHKDWTEKAARSVFQGSSLVTVVGAYFVIAIVGYLLQVLATALKAHVQRHIFGALRAEASKVVLTSNSCDLPPESNVAAQLSTAVHQGASLVASTYGYILDGSQYIFSIATAILFVATKSIPFAVVFVAFVGLQAFMSVIQAKRLRTQREQFDRARNELAAKTDDILEKREVILAWDQEDRYSAKLDDLTNAYASVERDLDVREAKFGAISNSMYDLGRIVVLLLAIAVTAGLFRRNINDVGDAYFLVALYVRLLVPATNLMMRYDSLKRSEATAATYLDLLSRRGASADGEMPDAAPLNEPRSIAFDNVSFSYEPARPVLDQCSFRVPSGKVTLLLGPSGSGKSTIARLILGFWKPSGGTITLDETPIDQLSSRALRALISYIAQDDYIVDDTVRDNLQWAAPTPKDGDMVKALTAVDIPDPAGRLDERAANLSFGEKQRLSLARLLLDTAPIIIMDEPVTGQDSQRLQLAASIISKQLGNESRTVLLVSHQLHLASIAHHVILLSASGRALEEGSVAELMARKEKFYELVKAAGGDLRQPAES